ncbi:MAG TPA: hypothetical protein VGK64_26285 [Bryobacteraceae bacterium]
MPFTVRKVENDLYTVTVTPPHSKNPWSTTERLSGRRLIEELKKQGCHPIDIADALSEVDPNWVSKLAPLND